MNKKSKITIDLSEFNNNDNNIYCELEFKFANMIIHFPNVLIKELNCNVDYHSEEIRDSIGSSIMKISSNLINNISGNYEFIPCVDKNNVQYYKGDIV